MEASPERHAHVGTDEPRAAPTEMAAATTAAPKPVVTSEVAEPCNVPPTPASLIWPLRATAQQTTLAEGNTYGPAKDWLFGYVCNLLDGALSGEAEDAFGGLAAMQEAWEAAATPWMQERCAGHDKPSWPEMATLTPSVRRNFGRRLRPSVFGPAVPEACLPMDSLPLRRATMPSPPPLERVDWAVLRSHLDVEAVSSTRAVTAPPAPSKPTAPATLRRGSRPSHRTLVGNCAAEPSCASASARGPSPVVPPKAPPVAPTPPASPPSRAASRGSRSRRNVMGAAARPVVSLDASTAARTSGDGEGRSSAFRLDAGDTGKSPTRDSSLARGYEALGAEFYSLAQSDSEGGMKRTATSARSQKPPAAPGTLHGPGRSPVESAMALDLPEAISAGRLSTMEQRLTHMGEPSYIPKVSKGTSPFLPSLTGQTSSAGSVAWSVRMARVSRRGGQMNIF